MNVLIACEFSGIVREAFKSKGHNAMSCDILPSEIPGNHYQGDVRDIIDDRWDLIRRGTSCMAGACEIENFATKTFFLNRKL